MRCDWFGHQDNVCPRCILEGEIEDLEDMDGSKLCTKCKPLERLAEYNKLLEIQNNCCDICKKHNSEFKNALSVDHNHTTGVVRGLLCSKCNHLLGLAEENCSTLTNATLYLKQHTLGDSNEK